MHRPEPKPTDLLDGAELSLDSQNRLVELLAAGVERLLRAGDGSTTPLTSSAHLCVYDDRADDCETDDDG